MRKIFLLVASITMLSCSSPESNGKDIANEYCDCAQSYRKDKIETLTQLNNSFDKYDFSTRREAKLKLEELKNSDSQIYTMCNNDVDVEYRKLRNKYATNEIKLREFEFSLNSQRDICSPTDKSQENSLISEINRKIKNIYPAIPNIDKIQTDIIGKRVIADDKRHRWKFEYLDEFEKVTINNSNIYGDNLELNVSIDLKSLKGTKKYKTKFIAYYYLRNDEWRFKNLNTIYYKPVGEW